MPKRAPIFSVPKLTPAQLETLYDLAGHVGEFKRGYGKSAAALARRGLAKRKFVSDDGIGYIAKFAITKAGVAALSNGDRR
jgi:hypothetical protein